MNMHDAGLGRLRLAMALLAAAAAALVTAQKHLLAQPGPGLANGEIARELYISEVTVKAHLGHVLTKLGLRDRAAAIV